MRQGKCGWARRRKWRYLDGTLPAPQKRQVEAHLQVCLPCRAEFTLAQDALNALAAGKPLTPEQQRALQRPKSGLTPSRAAAVATLALLLGAGVYLWRVQGAALLERLSARGAPAAERAVAAPTPAPTEPAVRPETAAPIEPPAAEPKPIEVAPKPVEAPPRAASPSPPRRIGTAPTRPDTPRRANPPTKPASQPATPPEGVVEVYDAQGNLIQRKQLREKR
jgi:outer membrane biosynthesis protein TonB